MTGLRLAAALAFLAASQTALAFDENALKPNQFQIAYQEPVDPKHQEIFSLLKEKKALEKFQDFLSPIRLPRPILLQMKSCDGEANGWYDFEEYNVTICYELAQKVFDDRPKEIIPAGVTPDDAFFGPMAEIFLHEAGHAVFDLLNVPILGHQEDAADQFAAYLILRLKTAESRKLIGGVAYMYAQYAEAEMKDLDFTRFADEHGQPAQRYFTYLCMAYGSDPKGYAFIMRKIPRPRAERCEAEYGQTEYALKKLVMPYVDLDVVKDVKSREWLKGKFKN